MPGEKAFYKILGHELMKELAGSCVGAELIPGGALKAYDVVSLLNGMHVRFTSWRGGEGPFYIILLFKGNKYVFELDLSMIVHLHGRFTWHLKSPSHENNVALLGAWLGEQEPFDKDYSALVKGVKSSLQSGINTPRAGYRFTDDVEWPDLCDRFLDLMRRAIKAHTTDQEAGQPREEAGDDDGSVVGMMRKARRNQSRFRLNMMELYNCACAISGEGVAEVLEAAHIASHSETGVNHTGNGLLLRSDLHRLFDASLIAVDPTSLQVVVSPLLAETKYQKLEGRKLRPRIDGSGPNQKYLAIRWNQAGLRN